MDALALRLHRRLLGPALLATPDHLTEALHHAQARAADSPLGPRFLRDEWEQVIDAWQVRSLEAYREIPRVGRRTRLTSSPSRGPLARVRAGAGRAGGAGG